jgi:hypothetical protein
MPIIIGAIGAVCGGYLGQFGWVGALAGAAGGGALGAVITGSEPGRAALTSLIIQGVFQGVEAVFKTDTTPSAATTPGEQQIKELKATNGANFQTSTGYELEGPPESAPAASGSGKITLEKVVQFPKSWLGCYWFLGLCNEKDGFIAFWAPAYMLFNGRYR